jgi:hypothetical protein
VSHEKPLWKTKLGKGLEQLSHDVFDAVRWMFSIGVVHIIALKSGSNIALALSYGLSVVLFLFLMSVFLLRGDVTVLRGDTISAKVINIAVNLTICTTAFASCLWVTYQMVDLFIVFQSN